MESAMEQNQLSGAAKELGGKIQEGVGRATGDAGAQLRGKMKQAEGSAQEAYGQAYGRAKEAAAEGADAVRELSGSVEDTLRHYIEKKPYTTAAIALAVGWVIGRSHRPL
jgi:uncharacterized protein YjbJ (UPF0337 family)